jgi:hypothetical protein
MNPSFGTSLPLSTHHFHFLTKIQPRHPSNNARQLLRHLQQRPPSLPMGRNRPPLPIRRQLLPPPKLRRHARFFSKADPENEDERCILTSIFAAREVGRGFKYLEKWAVDSAGYANVDSPFVSPTSPPFF